MRTRWPTSCTAAHIVDAIGGEQVRRTSILSFLANHKGRWEVSMADSQEAASVDLIPNIEIQLLMLWTVVVESSLVGERPCFLSLALKDDGDRRWRTLAEEQAQTR